MDQQTLPIHKIVRDSNIMPREKIDEDYVQELLEDLKTGTNFPPVEIFNQGRNYLLVDGFHRILAMEERGIKKVQTIVHKGNRRAALIYSCGVNSTHGLRRTNKDKRKTVFKLLKDKEWQTYSDGLIADKCAVSQPFVSKLREELTHSGFESTSTRTGKDGRTTYTKNVGKKANTKNSGNSSTDQSNSVDEVPLEKIKLSIPELLSDKKRNKNSNVGSNSTDEPQVENPKNSNKKILPENDAQRIVAYISNFINTLQEVEKILGTQKPFSVNKLRRLKIEMEKLFIDLSGEMENLFES